MEKGDLLFVYGTLRRSASSDLSDNLGVDFVGEDKIHGGLYALGWFPGVKLTPSDLETPETEAFKYPVIGDVFRIRDGAIVARLDAYEGYPSLYDRSRVTTLLNRTVWVYTYNPDVSEDKRIASGDWIKYSQENLPRPVSAG